MRITESELISSVEDGLQLLECMSTLEVGIFVGMDLAGILFVLELHVVFVEGVKEEL